MRNSRDRYRLYCIDRESMFRLYWTTYVHGKKGIHTRAKSLNQYRITYHPKLCLRLSQKNFGQDEDIKSVPLYAVFCID